MCRRFHQGLGHLQHLIHAQTPTIAGAIAARAATPMLQSAPVRGTDAFMFQPFLFVCARLMRLIAGIAHAPQQALCEHHLHRRCHHILGCPHIHQAEQGARGIARMQGGKHQMPGHGGAQTDLRGFRVAHFSHQNDVRILAQGRAQHPRKTEIYLLVHLYLIDPWQTVFHRVFHRDDLLIHGVDLR